VADQVDIPLSAAQRSRIRRLSQPKEADPGEEAGELNIVPYLDIIMNIIVFVIATISVVFMSTIETVPPSAGGGRQQTRAMQSQALNLVALITKDGISLKAKGGNVATGCDTLGEGVAVPKKGNGEHDFPELSRCVRALKEQNEKFADETQVTLTANPGVAYQVVIDTIDALRQDEDGVLFPDVRFGVAR
jgi:biopolymer transport protein ExbD